MARDPGRATEGQGSGGPRPLRLRDWLVAQIESGRYAGLRWEDAAKTVFRIPWKHAAKQDYRAQQDAALFRAWAIYKGKHQEGIDKEDPPAWKTRLRCALNKSTDFLEVRESSQLDCAEPYKVYRIVSDGAPRPDPQDFAPLEKKGHFRSQQAPPGEVTTGLGRGTEKGTGARHPKVLLNPSHPRGTAWGRPCPQSHSPTLGTPTTVSPGAQDGCEAATEKDKEPHPRWAQRGSLPPAALAPDPLADHRYQAQDLSLPWTPSPWQDFGHPDCWLRVQLFYGAELVRAATVRTAEGCHLCPRATVGSAEHLLGWPRHVAQFRFPEPPPGTLVLRRLLPHLERGVLLWVLPEGVFAKRLCQGRVYWSGPLAPHRTRPNKLERERTCQLLDTRRFLAELRAHLLEGCPEPEYKIRLCFGEEYPGPPGQPEERLIMAHVEPLFARELLLRSKGLNPAAPGLPLSPPEELLPPLRLSFTVPQPSAAPVPQVCPTQRAADATCSPAHTVPVTREPRTTQGPGRGDSGSPHL
ncbi:interferon regulatory factor 4 isoform X1 [Sorex araneus]|uniref:interferon regulatory factor 4 isoform X1 n=1 Tax=Sorex araneus TaxID=42254 RepID=UPI0024337D87|nr:interferon regulatory factor 4 isoform X1 [Sorex araneus]